MADTARSRKLAERIHQIVAEALEKRIKDPRLGFATVTEVRVTNDLQHATVFYTVLGGESERADTAVALESARGVLRSEVGKGTGVRITPTLDFVADAIPENANHIEDLLREAAARDAELAARAAGATYAGEADPYRHPEIDDVNDELDDDEDLDEDDDDFDDASDEDDGSDGDGSDDAGSARGGVRQGVADGVPAEPR